MLIHIGEDGFVVVGRGGDTNLGVVKVASVATRARKAERLIAPPAGKGNFNRARFASDGSRNSGHHSPADLDVLFGRMDCR